MPSLRPEAVDAALSFGCGGVCLVGLLLMCRREPLRRITNAAILLASFAAFGALAAALVG